MKVLMPALHYYPVVGGIETWTRQIAEMISQKADVFVVTGRVQNQPKKEEKDGLKIIRTSLFTLKNLSHSPLIYTVFLLPFIFFRSLILIKKEKINILHCQGFLSSVLGFCLSKITGVPYITTVQRLESKHNPLKNFIYRRAVVCIGASFEIKENFEAVGVKKAVVIPNGIDLKRFDNLDRQKSRDFLELKEEFVIMTIARLEKVKGVDRLIEAMIKGRLPEINYRLLIIGDGSERKGLESLIKKLNLQERVRFLGELPNSKVPEYLVAADCFVLPSRSEGFGIALLEARAAHVPVIGIGVGGIVDIIGDGDVHGILIRENQNSESISNAIFWIYNPANKNNVRNIIERSDENLKKYNWQNIAERVYQIYQQAV